jgi:hypothetical protein
LIQAQLYHYQVRAVDKAGNISDAVDSVSFKPDTTAPAPNFWFSQVYQSRAANSAFSPEYSWVPYEDTLSGMDHYEASLGTFNGGTDLINWLSITTVTLPQQIMVVIPVQVYVFNLRSVDKAGNKSSIRTFEWTIPQGIVSQINIVGHGPIYNNFSNLNSVVTTSFIRLNTDGTPDSGFIVGTGFDAEVNAIAFDNQVAGRIYVAGNFTQYNGIPVGRIARLNSNGSLDTNFAIATGIGFGYAVNDINVISDGRILVAGYFSSFNGVNNLNQLVCLNSDGTRDLTYPTTSSVTFGYRATKIRRADANKIFLVSDGMPFAYSGNSYSSNIIKHRRHHRFKFFR